MHELVLTEWLFLHPAVHFTQLLVLVMYGCRSKVLAVVLADTVNLVQLADMLKK
jgi:hypothetical protein